MNHTDRASVYSGDARGGEAQGVVGAWRTHQDRTREGSHTSNRVGGGCARCHRAGGIVVNTDCDGCG